MKIFKEIFLATTIIFISVSIIVYFNQVKKVKTYNESFKELNENDFYAQIEKHDHPKFREIDTTILRISLDNGENYFHEFKSKKEVTEFISIVSRNFGSVSYGGDFYSKFQVSRYFETIWGPIVLYAIISFFTFWILGLFNLLKSEFKEPHNKYVWLAVFIILPILAPFLYFNIAAKQKLV